MQHEKTVSTIDGIAPTPKLQELCTVSLGQGLLTTEEVRGEVTGQTALLGQWLDETGTEYTAQ